MALSNRISENANVLLEHGADVNFVGYTAKSGPIPCFPDSVIKCPDLIPAFLKRGVDPNVTINGQPVLLYSMKNYDMAVIEAFVRAGADVNAKFDGKSMLEHCSSFCKFINSIFECIGMNTSNRKIYYHEQDNDIYKISKLNIRPCFAEMLLL